MKASDLPYEVKQRLLRQIEEQAGAAEYNRVVSAVGEDKLLDLALERAGEMTKSRATTKTKGFMEKYGWWVVAIFALFSLGSAGVIFQILGIVLSVVVTVLWLRDKGVGFGQLLWTLFILSLAYAYGRGLLGGGGEWWHHVLAIPVGLFFIWLISR